MDIFALINTFGLNINKIIAAKRLDAVLARHIAIAGKSRYNPTL